MSAEIFKTPELGDSEKKVLELIAPLRKVIQQATGGYGAPRKWLGSLRSTIQAKAIQGSNSIEGYQVSIEDAIAAVEGQEILHASEESKLAVEGYQAAMTYVLRMTGDPYFLFSNQLLKSLHYMMLRHKPDKSPGLWRPGAIHVENERGEVVYQAPDIERVPALMDALITSLLEPPSSVELVSAAMAHLNLVMIHPYSDGNGRMARCLQTLVLARSGALEPYFWTIEEYLGRRTLEYYAVLAEVGNGIWSPERDAMPWIRFCLTAHYRQAATLVRRIEEIGKVWAFFEDSSKRLGFPERAIYALSDAAMGYRVRNSTYRSRVGVTNHTASRDLKLLTDLGLLIPAGEKRGRTYSGSSEVRAFFQALRAGRKGFGDPFVEVIEVATSSAPRQTMLFPAS